MEKYTRVTGEMKRRVLSMFYTGGDNTAVTIAKQTGVKLGQVNKIITKSLDKKNIN